VIVYSVSKSKYVSGCLNIKVSFPDRISSYEGNAGDIFKLPLILHVFIASTKYIMISVVGFGQKSMNQSVGSVLYTTSPLNGVASTTRDLDVL